MMNSKDMEDLDTWVTEVEMAQDYIKKLANNEITIKEFDDKQDQKSKEKQKKDRMIQIQQEEKANKVVQGRSGKGEKKNYSSFCNNCFWEYELLTPKCLRCDKETQTQEDRYNHLLSKLESFKQQKQQRLERKHKWDMWQKTQSILWKKNSNNYSKWDYYTDSSDEEKEEEPIVPKDDPNFKALEQDLKERKKKVEEDQAKAELLKDEGNLNMEKKQYHKAIEVYSDAIEIKRDFKVLYTNRALAYIKVCQYELAVKDCTKLLDYVECFENGYEKSKPITFKAFLRRALAFKHLKKYQDALNDIEQCLILDKNDKQALLLKEEVEQQIQIDKKIQDIQDKTEDIDSQIKLFMSKELNKENFVGFCVYLNGNQDFKTYFQKHYGVKTIMEFLEKDLPCYLLLNIYIENNPLFQEEFIKKKGVELMFKKAKDKLKHEDQSDIFENLTTLTLNDMPRTYMQNLVQTEPLIQNLFMPLLQDYEQNPENLSSFINLISNLCYGGASKTKKFLTSILDSLLPQIQTVIDCKKKRSKFLLLKENTYNLLSNLLTDQQVRKQIGSNKPFLQSLLYRLQRFDTSKDLKWVKAAEALLGVFINLCHEQIQQNIENLDSLQICQKLQAFFYSLEYSKQSQEVINRALNVFSKIDFNKNNFDFSFIQKIIPFLEKEYIEQGYVNHVLRIMIRVFQIDQFSETIKTNMTVENYSKICQSLCYLINQNDELRFCNACNFGGNLVKVQVEACGGFKSIIPKLIQVVKDETNLKRKNAAIFLAKLSKNAENLELIRNLHGIELLHSVSRFIVNE